MILFLDVCWDSARIDFHTKIWIFFLSCLHTVWVTSKLVLVLVNFGLKMCLFSPVILLYAVSSSSFITKSWKFTWCVLFFKPCELTATGFLKFSCKALYIFYRYQGMIKGYSGVFRLGEATSTWDADSPVCSLFFK